MKKLLNIIKRLFQDLNKPKEVEVGDPLPKGIRYSDYDMSRRLLIKDINSLEGLERRTYKCNIY